MLKVKDNVDLKELEKFGFKYEEEYMGENEEDLTKFYYKDGFYVFVDDKKFDDDGYGIRDVDIMYDLIKADLVEKVDD